MLFGHWNKSVAFVGTVRASDAYEKPYIECFEGRGPASEVPAPEDMIVVFSEPSYFSLRSLWGKKTFDEAHSATLPASLVASHGVRPGDEIFGTFKSHAGQNTVTDCHGWIAPRPRNHETDKLLSP